MFCGFKRQLVLCGCFVVLSLSCSGAGFSQELTGTVLDESGANIAKAFVLVHPDSAGIMSGDHRKTLTMSTDNDGKFRAPVGPGFYDVCAMAMAFSAECRKIRIMPGQSQSIQFQLKVSADVVAVLGDRFGSGQTTKDHEEFVYNRRLIAHSQSFVPKNGFVPDKTTAVAIAYAVAVPIYGKKVMDKERPFRAELKDGVWTILGTLHCTSCVGGTLLMQIDKASGKILFVIHTE